MYGLTRYGLSRLTSLMTFDTSSSSPTVIVSDPHDMRFIVEEPAVADRDISFRDNEEVSLLMIYPYHTYYKNVSA